MPYERRNPLALLRLEKKYIEILEDIKHSIDSIRESQQSIYRKLDDMHNTLSQQLDNMCDEMQALIQRK
jgi:hypothetical protein